MILNHINHKMPIYKDCTLGEMLFVGFCTFALLFTSLSIITKVLFGFAWIGTAFAILSLVHTTRILLGRLQVIKYGKPYGYYKHVLLNSLHSKRYIEQIIKFPFVVRIGKWSVRRCHVKN